jgi:hypothetical protein
MLTKYLSENLKGRDHSGDLSAGGRIILNKMGLSELRCEGIKWNRLLYDRMK